MARKKPSPFLFVILIPAHTSVLCVCMRTFLTLPARFIRGDRFAPEKPGFCIPKPDASRFRGFFKLDRSGDLVTDPSSVDPFDTLVTVVFIDITLPWPLLDTYGLPDESVIEMPVRKKCINDGIFHEFYANKGGEMCQECLPPDRPSRKPGLLIVVAAAPVISMMVNVGSPDTRHVNMTSYKAATTNPIDNTTKII